MSDRSPDISIIVVSFNTRDLLFECLQSIADSRAANTTEVWVVDNGSTDASADMVADRFPEVQLIRNEHNHGFAAANNQSLERAQGRYVLLLNSDTRILGDCADQLQLAFHVDSRLGIVGPSLLNPDSSLQPSWGNFPTALSEFAFQSFLFKVWPSGLPYGRRVHPLQRSAYQHFRRVDWVTGAALMLRREVYQSVGGLPEDTFMYAEDLEYCWRARQAGFYVAYCPAGRVIHHGQASARRDYQHWIVQYTGALLSYYERHCAPAEFRSAARLIWGGSLLRQVLWRLVGLTRPSRRQEVASRIVGYSQAASLAVQSLRREHNGARRSP